MQVYFSSDHHFGHGSNIIKYCNRPFDSVEKMHKRMIHNWNQRIKPEDTIYYLGDFVFQKHNSSLKADYWIKQLNGHKVFVRGNHDGTNSLKTHLTKAYLYFHKRNICLTHRPEDADLNADICLVGHVHDKWTYLETERGFMCNVGVDVWDYRPVKLEEILKAWHHRKRSGVVKQFKDVYTNLRKDLSPSSNS